MTFARSLLVVGGALLAACGDGGDEKRAQIPYSEFKALVRAGEVAEVAVGDTHIRGVLKKADEGQAAFSTTTIDDPKLVEDLEGAQIKYSGEVVSRWIPEVLGWVVPILLLIALWTFFFRRIGGAEGGVMAFARSKAKIYAEDDVKVSFQDVAGVDEAAQELREIVEFLKTPRKYTNLGGKIPKGVLLVGPPGTGKTLRPARSPARPRSPSSACRAPSSSRCSWGSGRRASATPAAGHPAHVSRPPVLRFYGVRGSIPVPGPATVRTGGNTPCVALDPPDAPLFILDAGTGLRTLGDSPLPAGRSLELLLTHTHSDHVHGLPFFGPLYQPGARLRISGPRQEAGLRTVLERLAAREHFPISATEWHGVTEVRELEEAPVTAGPVVIRSTRLCHPGPTLGYRLELPAREEQAEAEAIYGPVAEHLSKTLGKKVVYKYSGNWGMYQGLMQKGAYDIVFDGPHFNSWRVDSHPAQRHRQGAGRARVRGADPQGQRKTP